MQLRLPRSQLSVDELTSYIQGLFTADGILKSVVVGGEISEFKKHMSGHRYFTLLGEESRVACALFRQHAGHVPKWPNDGDEVLVEGSVGIYPQRGVYQLYARRLIPVGAGAIDRARIELKARLEKEGLFASELKRPLPAYPEKVVLITSGTGAAVWDVIRVAERRYPSCRILLIPTQVQGVEAPCEIERAFARVAAIPKLDCVLLVRGGGGREDLVPFDDERVVRAVRSCPVPVVSGVGHDVDITLCDMAADLHASTPSAAAELVFPDCGDIARHLIKAQERLTLRISEHIFSKRADLAYIEKMLASRARHAVQFAAGEIDSAGKRMDASIVFALNEARKNLDVRTASLDALSPLSVMARGFVSCERGGARVTSASALNVGDDLNIRFADGTVNAIVNNMTVKKN